MTALAVAAPVAGPSLILVPPTRVAEVWPAARPHVERALGWGDGEFDITDTLAMIASGQQQLWLSIDDEGAVVAVCVTQLVAYPRSKVCVVLLVGAEDGAGLAAVRQGVGVIEDFARLAGCAACELVGRQGWERVLPAGWAKRAILMRREL